MPNTEQIAPKGSNELHIETEGLRDIKKALQCLNTEISTKNFTDVKRTNYFTNRLINYAEDKGIIIGVFEIS